MKSKVKNVKMNKIKRSTSLSEKFIKRVMKIMGFVHVGYNCDDIIFQPIDGDFELMIEQTISLESLIGHIVEYSEQCGKDDLIMKVLVKSSQMDH